MHPEGQSFSDDYALLCFHQYYPAAAVTPSGTAPGLRLDAAHVLCNIFFTSVVELQSVHGGVKAGLNADIPLKSVKDQM